MKTKTKKIVVEVDASTWRWLRALARSNAKTDFRLCESTPEGLLAQAAFCFADAAGRRTGSWEASVGESLLDSSGIQKRPDWEELHRCRVWDEQEQVRQKVLS